MVIFGQDHWDEWYGEWIRIYQILCDWWEHPIIHPVRYSPGFVIYGDARHIYSFEPNVYTHSNVYFDRRLERESREFVHITNT
jgi:hypothetical protein